jgi:hypothetical protein
MQLWQYVYWSLQDYSTCFGRFLRPSSGILKTVLAATGACHGSGIYISCEDVQGRLPLHYVIVYSLRIMEAESVRNM